MKRLFAIIFSTILIASLPTSLGAMQGQTELEERESKYIPNYVPRGLLIFLDDSEEEMGAVAIETLGALRDGACPILVSAWVLHNIFLEYFDYQGIPKIEELKKQTNEDLVQKFTKQPTKSRNIALLAARFNPQQWIIKKIQYNESGGLYLLIPRNYLDTLKLREATSFNTQTAILYDPETATQPKKISSFELWFGLKINHMEDADFNSIVGHRAERKEGFMGEFKGDTEFASTLTKKNKIFCTHSEYQENGKFTQPRWSLFLIGHGHKEQGLLGYLSLNDAKKMLDFYSREINTKNFLYNSCFAAGTNTQKVYQANQNNLQEPFPFAIITLALTDAPVIMPMIEVLIQDKQLVLKTPTNFTGLMKELLKTDGTNYHAALENITTRGAQSTPQIKLPGTHWFSVAKGAKDIVSIGTILAKTRSPEKPLDIITYFKTNPEGPEALLLYAAEIPFPLILNTTKKVSIISMVPGDAFVKIAKISSPSPTDQMLKSFMSIRELDAYKIFYIKELNEMRDVIIRNEPRHSATTFFARKTAFFLDPQSGNILIKDDKDNPARACSEPEQRQYQGILTKIRGEIDLAGSYKVDSKYDLLTRLPKFDSSPQFYNSTIIDKIEGKNDADLHSILMLLYRGTTSREDFIWCKILTAPFKPELNSRYLTLMFPSKKTDDIISLSNVIIDRSKLKKEADGAASLGIYFTYNGQFYYSGKKIDYDYMTEYKTRKPAPMIPGQLSGALLPSTATAEEITTISKMYEKRTKELPPVEKKKKRVSSSPAKRVWTRLHDFTTAKQMDQAEALRSVKEIVGQQSVDINTQDTYGMTALFRAADHNLAIVKLLAENGADVDLQNDNLEGPIHRANLEVLKYLVLEKNADVNLKDRWGETRLHRAAKLGDVDVIQFLVQVAGARINIKNNDGKTPYDLAYTNDIKRLLRR